MLAGMVGKLREKVVARNQHEMERQGKSATYSVMLVDKLRKETGWDIYVREGHQVSFQQLERKMKAALIRREPGKTSRPIPGTTQVGDHREP